jgi:predicted kinase
MELKVLILKGLPGSGKSTFAQQLVAELPKWRRVNKDDLRKMFGGYKPKHESEIINWRDTIIGGSLNDGWNIVVDDTNFHPKHEAAIRSIAKQYNADVAVKFIDTPLEECIRRDARRAEPVGEKVIKKMWRQYVYKPVPRKEHEAGKTVAIICDLDGTLCLHNGRSPYDTDKCDTDEINPAIQTLLNDWKGTMDYPIIFVSGREEKYLDKTLAWLKKHDLDENMFIYMRSTGDKRPDDVVKEEIYKEKIEPFFNISYVLDDRNRVVDMWRRNGLTCLQVAEGDF